MKILRLEINHVRGICNVVLPTEGKNFVICGPNGSGKSAVVDALDFLLTGRISRLSGSGTKGITLARHGPHIDSCENPERVIVKATVEIPGIKDPVEISRSMDDPSTLVCDDAVRKHLAPVLTLAERGQHVLTRREILKYIHAESGTRAEEIQRLLNIGEIEDIRKTFVAVKNECATQLKDARRIVEAAQGQVSATIQEVKFDEAKVLEVVNANRAILGGKPLLVLRSNELKTALTPPSVSSTKTTINPVIAEKDITNLSAFLSTETQDEISEADQALRLAIETIKTDPQLLRSYSHRQLIELGTKLVSETDCNCPLCEKEWEAGKLKSHLDKRLSSANAAKVQQDKITTLTTPVKAHANTATASIQNAIKTAKAVGSDSEVELLEGWRDDLKTLTDALASPVEKYPDSQLTEEAVKKMLIPNGAKDSLDRMSKNIKATLPVTTPEQTAWDVLTRLEENLKAYEQRLKDLNEINTAFTRANELSGCFEAARDAVLIKLYDTIKDRFVELYKALHEPDEAGFTAKLEPSGAGLSFEVDFYGRGTHPPHALHSEGHQDSMGLCLYLALAEHLTKGIINLIILDDVVMSVDTDHRRQLCTVIRTFFPDRQFLITTHDKTWCGQLKSEGVVTSKRITEFYNWHVSSGPQVNNEVGMWERINEDLTKNDIPSGAQKLRRGMEEFFRNVCDALQGQITYKMNGRWELGEFLPSAMSQYSNWLKKAKAAANSWNQQDIVDQIDEAESVAKAIYTRTQAEQWPINSSVHYNEWHTFSKNDFKPVMEAFQDLYGVFTCSNPDCGSVLQVMMTDGIAARLGCSCGKVNWNLMSKPK